MTKIGILSDAHGNGAAFRIAVHALLKNEVTEIYFLGDAIGYIPSLSVLAEIEAHKGAIHCIKGNHECMFLNDNFDILSDDFYLFSMIRSEYQQKYNGSLDTWSDHLVRELPDFSVLFVHGSPKDYTNGYVYPDTDLSLFDGLSHRYVFMGHTHRPFVRTRKNITYINVGSCGLPRDHGHYGSAALFDLVTGKCRILRFNISNTLSEIFEKYPRVHSKVADLSNRQPGALYGEIVC